MDVEWKELSESEQSLLRGLSADLYSLTNEEIPPPASVSIDETTLIQTARREYEKGDWLSLLTSLRLLSDRFPRQVIAYMRGRGWRELGRPEPALWFLELAHQLEPSDPHYELLALDAMFRSSRRHDAIARAETLLEAPGSRPHVVFGAAKVVSEVAPLLPEDQAKKLYMLITKSVRAAFERIAQDQAIDVVPSLLLAARLNLAIAYERLGDPTMALEEYDRAVAAFPGRDEIVIARAMFLLGADPDRGRRELGDLVQRNTSSAYPYFFLAYEALQEERFDRCIELCARVLQNTTQTLMRAQALEWTAIAIYERGGNLEAVKELFSEAIHLSPLNENFLKNLEIAKKPAQQPKHPLSVFAISRPVQPADVTTTIHSHLAAV